jgi:aspartyl-tRNA(Asn)/glutamyl-tRNA(Gln) amidotransferase subunit B
MSRLLNLTDTPITEVKFQPRHLLELVKLTDEGTLSSSMAKTVFEEMFGSGRSPRQIAEEAGMAQLSDVDSIRPVVEEAIAQNPKAVGDYLEGKETAVRFLIGQVMKVTRGEANPQIVSDLLTEKLESLRQEHE